MANFAPVVNTRGAVFTHEDGIVKRSTYFIFVLYTKYMGDTVLDSYTEGDEKSSTSKVYRVKLIVLIRLQP